MPKIGQSITQKEYYQNNGADPASENWGTYQYLLLEDIVLLFSSISVLKDDIKIIKFDFLKIFSVFLKISLFLK